MKRSLIPTVAAVICAGAIADGADRWIGVSGGEWEPRVEALQPMREGLETYVREQAQAAHRTLQDWNDYTFQFQGQTKDGRRFLFVNALCRVDADANLHERIVFVLDGGSCYFTVKYDPSAQRFYDLVINGDA